MCLRVCNEWDPLHTSCWTGSLEVWERTEWLSRCTSFPLAFLIRTNSCKDVPKIWEVIFQYRFRVEMHRSVPLVTYFPSRMSYNTMRSALLLDIAFSPLGLKSTQLIFFESLRYVLATLKLLNTLSVIFISGVFYGIFIASKQRKRSLVEETPLAISFHSCVKK